MTIEFRCQNCQSLYKVKEEHGGKRTKCKKCEVVMEIPVAAPSKELPKEKTDGGSAVYRYEERTSDFEMAIGNEENIEIISKHIERYIGPIEAVFHEIVSDLVHIDVHFVKPSQERPFHTLITSGMSDRPMAPPPDCREYAFAELMICLPPEWPISDEAFNNPNNYWPVEWLKRMARFPHEYQTWLFEGHTVPNGDPAEPFARNTKFCGWLLFPPALAPEEFHELKVSPEKTIYFFSLFPLYESEMNLKLKKGTEELINRMADNDVCELIELGRKNVAKKGLWPFG